jgi:DNA mismatch repair protein MLH3
MYETLKSLACHNAIKFNDILSMTECHHLLNELKSCSMPFICAHGRTSAAILWEYDIPSEEYQVDMTELQQLASIHKWLKES